MKRPLPELPISIAEIQKFIADKDLDFSKDSGKLLLDIENAFARPVRTLSLVHAALFLGYAVIPQAKKNTFKFHKVEEW